MTARASQASWQESGATPAHRCRQPPQPCAERYVVLLGAAHSDTSGLEDSRHGSVGEKKAQIPGISQESRSQLFQGRWGMAFLLPITSLPGEAWQNGPRSRSFAPHYPSEVP